MVTVHGQAPKGWVVDIIIHTKGDAVINKTQMIEYFGAAWASANIESIFLGRGTGYKPARHLSMEEITLYSKILLPTCAQTR